MSQITSRKVPLGSSIFPHQHRLSAEEIAKIEAEDKALARRCREIFDRVYPQLAGEYYDWFIVIDPESGDYRWSKFLMKIFCLFKYDCSKLTVQNQKKKTIIADQ
ncbi:hypothetical protein [Microcystis aeruginosa]|uniref:hypothetical protein n=1 Tax=Microcystis aeruginosa TaxID=1126 RepID=UPI0023309744|nr:hypothetical protein [Microcystis aeruginosa]MDB9418459.1 hypothetical protein [Microcystis aeruginosa CS-556/03]